MSESEEHEIVEEVPGTSDAQIYSAEYKDGQLQIVEVASFDKGEGSVEESAAMPASEEDDGDTNYVQVIHSDKSTMQLDLLNLTLVRCEEGGESYRLVSNDGGDSSTEATVTCVLHSSDNEEADSNPAFVKVNWDQGPLVFLQSSPEEQEPPSEPEPEPQPQPAVIKKPKNQSSKMSPTEILERAKALQKAKQEIMQSQPSGTEKPRRGRKRKSDLPPPHELLSSPNFKLFLYSCKLCSFKCNAVKEMTAHKTAEHSSSGPGGNKWRRGAATATLQCAVCPYRSTVHSQLMKHIQEMHADRFKNKVMLDTEEVEMADVLVCGACGYESGSRVLFRAHIETVHGATAC